MPDFRIVDVFAEARFEGNQLAVVLDGDGLSDATMLQIAAEFDYSETTFVLGRSRDAHRVRIFTPSGELPFAGHPTLGTASVLRSIHGGDRLVLALGVGDVPVDFEEDDGGTVAWMTPPGAELGPPVEPEEVAGWVGLSARDIDPDWPVCHAELGPRFLMVPVAGLDALVRAKLDVDRIVALREAGRDVTGLYLFCRETHVPGRQVAARMLWEANGAREDPATGSACVCLGSYAAERGYLGEGDVDALVEQGYEMGRPSLLRLRVRGRGDALRISVGGRGVEIARGTLVGVGPGADGA